MTNERLTPRDLRERGLRRAPTIPGFESAVATLAGLPSATATFVAPPAAPAVAPEPVVLPPAPAATNPFADLPFPSPGDRIKADDFKKLSLALRLVGDAYALSAALCGLSFRDARTSLAMAQYEVARAYTVFGTALAGPDDTSLDGRKVLNVVPAAIGDRRVIVLLSEEVDARRFMPNLLGLTYPEARERMQLMVGTTPFSTGPVTAPQLVGTSLADAGFR